MKPYYKTLICIALSLMCVFTYIGYATLSDNLTVFGSAYVEAAQYDVYISDVSPSQSEGITVTNTAGTVLTAKVFGSGTSTFNITVKNISDTIYVFDRVIDGAEAQIEGAYSGADITYELSRLTRLDELAPDSTISFTLQIHVPEGITAEYYILKFNFVEKFAAPGEEYFPEEMPEEEISIVQRLSNILNNKYEIDLDMTSRDFLINETIQVYWQPGAAPYVGSMDKNFEDELNVLFGDILNISSVSFILKNEDLNDDTYSEIALYSTSDLLDSSAEWPIDGVVCVYVTVFTPVINEQKEIIGYNLVCEAMRGYCYEVRYGSTDLTPSFSTDEWRDDLGYMIGWDDQNNTSILERIPVDAMSADGTKPYRLDYESYNRYYNWCYTTPYGNKLWQCLAGKIPYLN